MRIYIDIYVYIYAYIYIYIYYLYIYMYIYIYIFYIYIYKYIYIYILIKTEQFCISLEIGSVILNLLLLTNVHIYSVAYNRYMQFTIK